MKHFFLIIVILFFGSYAHAETIPHSLTDISEIAISGDLEKAKNFLMQNLAIEKSNPGLSEAINIIDRYQKSEISKEFAISYFQALEYLQEKSYKEAIQIYQGLNPQNAAIFNGLTEAYFALKDSDRAVTNAEQAIRLEPDNHIANENLCHLYMYAKNDFQQSINSCRKVISIDQTNYRIYQTMGDAYYGLKDYKNALGFFLKAVELRPDLAYAYVMMGNCSSFMMKYDDAVSFAEKAIEINPDNARAQMDLAINYAVLKNFDKAKIESQKAIEILKSKGGYES